MRMVIQGGMPLKGCVTVRGSKNAVGPLIASSLIVKGTVRLKNVPRILDVMRLLEILKKMGATVEWPTEHELRIDTRDIDPSKLDKKMMKQIRFSILLLGPMLARFKKVTVPEPGGDIIGKRPIDTHLEALGRLGAMVEAEDDHGGLKLEAKELIGGSIVLPEFSVTATENLIMAAVLAKGRTSIRLAAAEPHVQELCRFLNAAGANIKGIGTHDLEIVGVKSLNAPAPWKILPDMIEIGTFAVAAALTHGDIDMSPVIPTHLDAVCSQLGRVGVKYEFNKNHLRVQGVGRMNGFKLQTMIYPGFPTDLQAPFGLLATQCHGVSLIHDPLFEARLGYLNELIKMGASAIIADPHRAVVNGPTPLRGTEIRSLDIRAGVTMVLAGLVAQGETIIHDAEMIDRGYEDIDGRLRSLGADIQRVEHEII